LNNALTEQTVRRIASPVKGPVAPFVNLSRRERDLSTVQTVETQRARVAKLMLVSIRGGQDCIQDSCTRSSKTAG